MIIGCLIFYNEEQFLSDWYKNLSPHVDRIVAIDGRFEDYPGVAVYSTDGSYAILGDKPDVTSICPAMAWPSQQLKRTAYLVGAPGDWYVVVDADEMLENGSSLRDEIDSLEGTPHEFAQIKVVGHGADRLAGRVFRHQDGLQYLHRHFWLGINGEVVWKGDTGPVLEDVYLNHRRSERSPERIKQKAQFSVAQSKSEFPFDR